MKVLCINRNDCIVEEITKDDWDEIVSDLAAWLEECEVVTRVGPGGLVYYITDEEMYLVIPD
jgi:hypothetical protein